MEHLGSRRVVSRGRVAPVAVVHPRGLLAVFAAVFGATAAPTLGKLSLELLPLATLVVGTLTDATSRLVLAAEISHDNARPVLHILRVVSNGELLHQGEDIDIVGEQVLVFVLGHLDRGRRIGVFIQKV
jgi:hypothetical protein